MFTPQTEGAWKKSWINDFSNNVKLANELNNIYADDIIQAVEEKDFDTLEAALDDLRVRIGVPKTAMKEIKKIALAKLKKSADDHTPSCECEDESEVPGNKPVAGDRLVKESPSATAADASETKTAGAEHLKNFQFKKKEEKAEGEAEEGKTDEKSEKKAAAEAKKKAWFQGATEPTVEGPITSNSPDKLGYPKEMGYEKGPMATTAPGGQDTRPWEQKWFEGAADETKKEMGPAGEEFKLKVEQQRIPEGEKAANASAKWVEHFKKSGSNDMVSKLNKLAWKQATDKKKA